MSETIDPPGVEEEVHTGPTPEEELAAARERITQAETQRDTERQARIDAERRAQQAGGAVQGAHEAALDAQMAAHTATLNAAKAALKSAREQGDIDSEIAAQEALAGAAQMVQSLKIEKGRKPAPQQQPEPQQGGQSAEAQRWIAQNPRFNADRYYRSTAEAAHFEAIDQGIRVDSPAYFRHLDQVMAEKYGDNHGSIEAMTAPRQSAPAAAPTRKQPPASSFATPSSRGSGTNSKGDHDVNVIADKIGVTPDEVRQFAADLKIPLEEYCRRQADALKKQNAIMLGDGQVFR